MIALSDAEAVILQDIGRKLEASKEWWDGEEQAEKRPAIRCVPDMEGLWRLTVVNAMGLICVGTRKIVHPGPKISVAHLLYLFWRSGELPRPDDELHLGHQREQLGFDGTVVSPPL